MRHAATAWPGPSEALLAPQTLRSGTHWMDEKARSALGKCPIAGIGWRTWPMAKGPKEGGIGPTFLAFLGGMKIQWRLRDMAVRSTARTFGAVLEESTLKLKHYFNQIMEEARVACQKTDKILS